MIKWIFLDRERKSIREEVNQTDRQTQTERQTQTDRSIKMNNTLPCIIEAYREYTSTYGKNNGQTDGLTYPQIITFETKGATGNGVCRDTCRA